MWVSITGIPPVMLVDLVAQQPASPSAKIKPGIMEIN
jgi:hypothetical protein